MPRLRVENLGLLHLAGVSFGLEAGTCATLSGPSGAGKTLLLRAICDLTPHSGAVFLDDVASKRFQPTDWRRRVGMLPAESRWWFDIVGHHFSPRRPEGLERLGFAPEVMGWEITRLSSGERQRLALLRLLANRPAVLLLDEPTANLDAANTTRVEKMLKAFCKEHGASLLWISHDSRQIHRVADRSLILEGGILREGQIPCM